MMCTIGSSLAFALLSFTPSTGIKTKPAARNYLSFAIFIVLLMSDLVLEVFSSGFNGRLAMPG